MNFVIQRQSSSVMQYVFFNKGNGGAMSPAQLQSLFHKSLAKRATRLQSILGMEGIEFYLQI